MMTETVQRMTAPHPPSDSAEPPSPVMRKLGFASATTNPSNQLIVLRSSRSSTTAVAIDTSESVKRAVGRYKTGFLLTGQADLPPPTGQRIGAFAHQPSLIQRYPMVEDAQHGVPLDHPALRLRNRGARAVRRAVDVPVVRTLV